MARLSDALMQGLIQPGFSFQGLSEPVGMLLGGAQAQRQAQERQMSSLRAGLTAPDLQSAVAGARTPQELQAAMQAYQMGQQERQQQATLDREQKFRDMVRSTASNLGPSGQRLLETVDSADIEDLRADFGSLMKNFQSNEGILKAFEVPQQEWSKYLTMSPKELLNLMKETQSFNKGTPRDYMTPSGNNVTYLTNARGQVRTPGGTWVNIEDLGLAPAVKKTASTDNQPIEDIIGKVQTKSLEDKLTAAEASLSILENNRQGQQILDQIPQGSFGPLANVEQLTRQAKIELGFANPDEIKTEADLNAFLNSRGQAVARALASGTYGAGTAISDADRKAAQELAAQTITATPETLAKILYLERKIAYADIKLHNEAVRRRISRLSPEQAERISPVFEIEVPQDFFAQPENYVKKYTDDTTKKEVYEDMFGVKRYADGAEYR